MATEPISTAEAMSHLRLDSDDPYIVDLPAYITAARQTVEQYLNASVVVQARTLVLDAFPPDRIDLPNGPPISVIEHCMRLVHTTGGDDVPTAEQLADRVRVALADPDLGQVRSALSRLVDAFVSEHAQTRSVGPAPQ